MAKFSSSQLNILSFAFLLAMHTTSRASLSLANASMSSPVTATSKDQIACTMCSSCENPCQPILSPPPPSPPPPPYGPQCPPPPPPPPSGPQCPPPPPSDGGVIPKPTPPIPTPVLPYLAPPPPAGGAILPFLSQPSLIVPYFPFDYFSPPPPPSSSSSSPSPPSEDMSYSTRLMRRHPFVSFLVVSLTLLSLI